MSKKISQLQSASGTDNTTFIPVVMGEPKVNRKISADNLIEPTYGPIENVANDLSKLAYTKDLDIVSDVAGYISYNSPAPTPEKSCKYEFTVGGACPWLNETVVFITDQVLVNVLETFPITYEYIHLPIVANYATPTDVSEAYSALDTKYDGAFAENGLLYFTIDGNIVGRGIEVGTSGGSGAESITTVVGRVTSGYTSTFAVPVGSNGENTKAILHYTFISIYNDTLESTGDQNEMVVYVGGMQVGKETIAQGNNTFDVGPYLSSGTNRVVVTITDSNGIYRNIQYTITVVAISLTSTFKDSLIYSDSIAFKYTPIGKELKTIYFELDGTIIDSVVTSESGSVLTETLPAQSHGGHTLNVYAQATVGGVIVTSNVLHYEIIWTEAGNTTPIIVSSFNTTEVEQYSTINIPYIVYDPMHAESTVMYYVNNNLVSTLSGVTSEQKIWAYRTSVSGSTVMKIVCGSMSKEFTVMVNGSSITSEATTNDLILYLTSAGKSNDDIDKDTWVYDNGITAITSTLTNFNHTSDGWLVDDNGNTFLRVAGDARVNIPLNIFAEDFKEKGRTIEFEFATRNITDYGSIAISSISGDKGIKVSTQTATLISELTSIATKFKEDERVRISFIVEKSSDNRIIYTYINGVMSGASVYKDTDNFRQSAPVGITIGSSGCTTDIYNIRVYENNLTNYQILDNYIYDMDNIEEKVALFTRNELLDDNNNLIYGNVLEQIPCMLITGTLPLYKGDKQTVDIRYDDLQNPTNSFILKGIYDNLHKNIDVQGTSSQYYPRKNYKLSLNKGELYDSTNTLTNGKYKLRSNSIPAKYFTVKADFAESSGTHNTGLAKISNELLKDMSYFTPPQKDQYNAVTGDSATKLSNVNVRTTVDGFPIAIFHRDSEFSDITFLGKYNFNIDKGSVEVFGFTSAYPVCESWEFLNNTSPRCLFRSSDFTSTYVNDAGVTKFSWTQDFEARYPDTDPAYSDVTNLSKLYKWLDTCNPDNATNSGFTEQVTFNELNIEGEIIYYTGDTSSYRLAKFKNEASQHFNINNLMSYFLITEIFGMTDQRAKNQFLTTWGNEGSGEYKWYFILYDNDTALGINNEGANIFPYNIEYHDTLDKNNPSSAKVWNGETSLLWYLVENTFTNEMQEMYHSLRSSDIISYTKVSNVFNHDQSDKWSEEIYNADGKFKYIEPYTIGYYDSEYDKYMKTDAFLYALQGNRKEHRKWWLYNRFKYIDSKYTSGDYESDFATMRLYTPSGETVNAVAPNPNFMLTPIADQYCKIKYGSYITSDRSYAEEDILITPNVPEGTTFNDTETIIYGVSRIKDLGDLSNKYLGTVDLTNATKLERLVVGSPIEGYDNPNLGGEKVLGQNQTFSVGSSQLLRLVDIRNCSGLVDPLDVSQCLNIEEIYAKGSSISSVTLANSGNLKVLQLPSTITSLTIKNQPLLSTGFTIESVDKLKTLTIEKTPGIDMFSLFTRCAAAGVLENINIVGLYGTTSDVNSLKYLTGLYGNITGEIIVEGISDADWLILTDRFPELIINKLITFADPIVESIVLSNWDSNDDNLIYSGELKDVTGLTGVFKNQTGITSFNELRYFLSTYTISDDFTGCTSLTGITLPTRVTVIGNDAFNGINSLKSVIYPSSLVTIGSRAFKDCINISGTLIFQGDLRTIGSEAFKNCIGFTGPLTFPSEIRNINSESFYGCTGFNGKLTFSNNLQTIGDRAFYNCSGFVSGITFPTTTTSIGDGAFYDCSGLSGTLIFGKNITNIGASAFTNCNKFTGSLTIPTGMTSIKDETFSGCTSFNGLLTLPSNLLTIGNSSFSNCTGFTGSLLIPNKVTSIGNNAFYNDKFNGTLTLPNTLTSIGNNAFDNCTKLSGKLILTNNISSIGESAFRNCSGFTGSLIIPSSVSTISDNTFMNCTGFNGKVTILGAENIGNNAFNSCNNITGLTLSDNLLTIGDNAFINCSNIVGSIEIPSGVTSMGSQAFYGVTNLTSIIMNTSVPPTAGEGVFDGSNCDIVIPTGSYAAYVSSPVWSGYTERYIEAFGFSDDEVERILVENWDIIDVNNVMDPEEIWAITAFTSTGGTNVFEGNTLIKVFNEMIQFTGLTQINNYDFSGCTSLTSTKLPDNIISIGNSAFYGCTSFSREMTIPDYVTNIGAYAYYNCINMPGSIITPSGVTTINLSTFENCHSLTNLTLNNSIISIGDRAFYNCYGLLGSLIIPNGVTSIGSNSFYNCSGLNGTLTLSKNITTIGANAFANCSGLDSIVIKALSVPTLGAGAFDNSTCDIFVPIESLDLYLTGTTWSTYSSRIKPYIDFKDSAVESIAINNTWDTNNDGVLSKTEVENITSLENKYSYNTDIKSFHELKYFTDLETIDINDFSGCIYLTGGTLPTNITSIGTNAFSDCQSITSGIIELTGLTSVGDKAFYNCHGLSGHFYAPNSLTTIGEYAFSGCYNIIGDLTIPSGVTVINKYTYYDCRGLNGVLNLPPAITNIGDYAFGNCWNLTGNINIPQTVNSIGTAAFKNDSSFNGTLTLPTGLTSISNETFLGCRNIIGEIEIPMPVTSIGAGAFSGCSGYNTLIINENVESIGSGAFNGNTSLTSIAVKRFIPPTLNSATTFSNTNNCPIYIPLGSLNDYQTSAYWSGYTGRYVEYIVFEDQVTEAKALSLYDVNYDNMVFGSEVYNVTNIGSDFNISGITSFNEFSYFTGVTNISTSAFLDNSTLQSITLPNTIKVIGFRAFENCISLLSFKFPYGLEIIWDHGFYGCTSLSGIIDLPETVVNMGSYTFQACSNVSAFIVRNPIPPTMGAGTLSNTGSGPIYIPYGSKDLYLSATGWLDVLPSRYVEFIKFDDEEISRILENSVYDYDLNNVLTPEEVTGDTGVSNLNNLFSYNDKIKNFNELSGFTKVTILNNNEFNECTSLSGMTLPINLTSIGVNSLKKCYSLSSITIPTGVTEIKGSAFYACTNISGITLPSNLTILGDSAFNGCTNLRGDVIIPSGVTTIGNSTFYECVNLSGVTLQSGVTVINPYAFYGCSSLENVVIYATTPPILGTGVFDGVNINCKIHVPSGSVSVYQSAWPSYSSMIISL